MKLFATSIISAVLALSCLTSFAAGDTKPEPAKAAKPVAYKPDVVKGQASFTVCAGCHGVDGNSGTPAYPKLAQQHPEYLVKQLTEYKSGKRANAIMVGFASALSEE
ncbi:MAG: c-type cytochrome, partial [Polaromonas sp.]|nr:c-type cytochrome [Polaromonas sp.]